MPRVSIQHNEEISALSNGMKIGIFDSGLGGLTVMKAITAFLPQYDYEFYGDTINLPYGDKTEEQIYELTKEGIVHLFERDCLLVIIACNTASAETLRRLQDTFLLDQYPNRKILGVIIPMVETTIDVKSLRTILIGTTRTINSKKYIKEFEKYETNPFLYSVATPQLVPLIETGKIEQAVLKAIQVVTPYVAKECDTLILGCTHYGLLKDDIKKHFGEKLRVLSADDIIPKKLETYLQVHSEIENKLTKNSLRNIYISKHTPAYDKLMGDILGGYLIQK